MSPMGEIGEEYIDLSVLFVTTIGEEDDSWKHLEQCLAHSECSVSVVTALIKCDFTLNRNLLNTNMYFVLSCNIKHR